MHSILTTNYPVSNRQGKTCTLQCCITYIRDEEKTQREQCYRTHRLLNESFVFHKAVFSGILSADRD